MKLIYLLLVVVLAGCGSIPVKKYFLLNYIPASSATRLSNTAYPYTIRLKEFGIEDAYARHQIVYRQSPYELQFYYYQLWAVKPAQMISDLVYKHLESVNLVNALVRRYDGGANPDYELSGTIEAIDEYDSDKVWFAHMAIAFRFTRIKDGMEIYSQRFDHRKRIFKNDPQSIVKEMSSILEFMMNKVVSDLDGVLSRE